MIKVSYLTVYVLIAYTDQWHAVPYERENMLICDDISMTNNSQLEMNNIWIE